MLVHNMKRNSLIHARSTEVLTSVEKAGSTAVGLGAFLERTSNILCQAIPLVEMSRRTQSTGPHTTICASVLILTLLEISKSALGQHMNTLAQRTAHVLVHGISVPMCPGCKSHTYRQSSHKITCP